MKNVISTALLIGLTSASSGALAQSAAYNWTVVNQFQAADGSPVKVIEPSTCAGMTCPVVSPSTIPQGGQASGSAMVTGQNAVGDVYVGFSANGHVNECDFVIGGGAVNSDGTCTAPHALAYTAKRTGFVSNVQPGCTVLSKPQPDPGKFCSFTAVFAITTYQ